MKKLYNLWLIACLVCLLSSCAAGQLDSTEGPSRGPTWQAQYDLGVRYLSEGNYEEAILTFTAAIEIDPKRVPAYVGRGDAYVKYGETDENLAAAKADYEKAIELDETNAEAYLGLADVYIRQGDYKKAREILAKGVDKTGSEALQEMLDGIFVEEVDANGFNAYGATAFTQREEYIPFTELTAEVQTFIASATTAVMGNDRDTLLALSETVALDLPIQMELSSQLYTVWNQHKIGVHISEIGLDSEGAYLNYFWKIEIRPQNGMGYYADVHKSLGFDESKNTNSWYYEYSNRTSIVSCPCIDWQWNGQYSAQMLSDALQRMDYEHWNGILCKMSREEYVIGQMRESLRDGTFTVVFKALDEFPDDEHEVSEYEDQYTESYIEGEFVGTSRDIPAGGKSIGNGKIYTITEGGYGAAKAPTGRFILGDSFYW